MTRWPNRETVTDQSLGIEPQTIRTVVPNCGVPRIATRTGAGDGVHDGGRLSATSQGTPIVFVVDDDVSMRKSLELLIRSARWRPEIFESARKFLHRERALVPSCLILGLELPGLNGFDLQKHLEADRKDMPIIFIADHGDVAMTVQAMKAGAFDFFTKPFCDDALLSAVRQAIERSRSTLDHELEIRGLRDRYSSLSCREREVMAFVTSGLMNKQVGFELGVSEITVKAHRGRVMRKMKAGSLADLVRMAMKLRASPGAAFRSSKPHVPDAYGDIGDILAQ
jgi:FixJ family two-component response regulator